MNATDIIDAMKSLGVADLKSIESAAKTIQATKKAEEERAFLAEMKEQAEARGIDIDALMSNLKGNKGKGIAKYQHPNNPRKTWTGKGRKPAWLQALLDEGKTLDDLKII